MIDFLKIRDYVTRFRDCIALKRRLVGKSSYPNVSNYINDVLKRQQISHSPESRYTAFAKFLPAQNFSKGLHFSKQGSAQLFDRPNLAYVSSP